MAMHWYLVEGPSGRVFEVYMSVKSYHELKKNYACVFRKHPNGAQG